MGENEKSKKSVEAQCPNSSEHGRPRRHLDRLIILHAFKLIFFTSLLNIYLAKRLSFLLGKRRRGRKKTAAEVPLRLWPATSESLCWSLNLSLQSLSSSQMDCPWLLPNHV